MEYIVVLGFYTIWFTPVIFVYNLFEAMKAIRDERETKNYTIACSISLMLIVIPILVAIMAWS